MIVDPDFLDHWRTRMVVDALGGDEMAPMYIMRLWAHCQNRKGDKFDLDAQELATACRFNGSAHLFESAMVEAGFVARAGLTVVALGVDRWLVRGRALDIKSTDWEALRLVVFERDGYRCRYCGEEANAPECDHILPFSRGGKSVLSNLATACMPCNRSKGAKTVAEWGRYGR